MTLTIAIPTYNRPEKIKKTVLRLLPQVTPEVKILILDNCSPVVVKDLLDKEIGTQIFDKVEVVRHKVNIGADSNFQRCFELCDTPFIWMPGDDDDIEENAVELILTELEKYKNYDLIGINFNSNCNTVERKTPITISSTSDLANKLDHFGNWLFISTSVYKTEEYLKHIRYQAWGAYSMASQLVPPMMAISQHKTLILSEKYIVTNIKAKEEEGDRWSDFQLGLSLATLIEAPVGFKKDEFRRFGDKMEIHFSMYPGEILFTILKSVNYNIDLIDNYHIYLLTQFIFRTLPFRFSKAFQVFRYFQCLFLLKNKRLLKLLLKLIPSWKRKAEEKVPFYLFVR